MPHCALRLRLFVKIVATTTEASAKNLLALEADAAVKGRKSGNSSKNQTVYNGAVIVGYRLTAWKTLAKRCR